MRDYGLFAAAMAELEGLSLEEAVEAGEEWSAAGGSTASNPISQWSAWHESLPRLKIRHEQGDPRAVLEALGECALHDLPIPHWCQKAYLRAWRKAKGYECRTLDEAFGYEVKGANLSRARERYRWALLVAIEVARRIGRDEKVEDALHAVAAERGISFSRAREWYYAHRRHYAVALYLPEESENPRKDGE